MCVGFFFLDPSCSSLLFRRPLLSLVVAFGSFCLVMLNFFLMLVCVVICILVF
jgi:hypothetical protein